MQSDKENFLKRKVKRNKNFKKEENPVLKSNLDKVSEIEILFRKAKIIYDDKSSEFDLDKPENLKNKDKKWTADIIKSGTMEDKISALALYIKKNPLKCLKYVDMLIKMAKKKNRRQTEACVMTLKDLFLENILTNKKLKTFYNAINTLKTENDQTIPSISDEKLMEIYIEDFIHKKYSEMIEIIEEIILNDPLIAIKKKYLSVLLQMISKRPEREEKILEVLINKLGDPDVNVSNYTIKILKELQMAHPKMSLVILKNVQNFINKINLSENKNPEGRYYALVFLSQMMIINDKEYLETSLEYFFDLFNIYVDHKEEVSNKNKSKKQKKLEENNPFSDNKFLSLILKRINLICRYSSQKNLPIKKYLNEKIDSLFKLSHSDSIKLRIEVLKLIFMICQGVMSGKNKNGDQNSIDRYYKSLYEILLLKDIIFSKHIRDLLKLIMMSLSFDSNLSRVSAFMKRLLQVSLYAEPPFITCVLIIISQILRNKHKLWKMIEKNNFANSTSEDQKYDFTKRDPAYTNADSFPISEIVILLNHYHPTVQKFSKFILENYNKDIINYEGDPLIDFSLLNFLEKFMLKNPKLKKEKTKFKSKAEKEEENLKKFLGEEENEEKIEKVESGKSGQNELEFIKKFNEIEKVKSVSYEKNQQRKKKKMATVDMEDGIDNYADDLIEKEYEKYDKDIDEDVEFDNLGADGDDIDDDEGMDLGEDGHENFDEEDEIGDDIDDNFEEDEDNDDE